MAAARTRLRAAGLERGFWALLDQSAVSLGTFLTNIVLARTLPAAEFGVYALIFGVVLFLNSLHSALVTYPLSVSGAATSDEDLRGLAGSSLRLTAMLALPLGAALLVAAGLVHRFELAPWALGALLLWQLQETLRRSLMAHLRYREALRGDVVSYLGQAGLVWLFARSGLLPLEAVFSIMAASSAIAAAMQAMQLGLGAPPWRGPRGVASRYWGMGRWLLFSNLINLITIIALPWVLAFFHGVRESAAFYALNTPLALANPVVYSISNLIIPAAARAHRQRGAGVARRIAASYAAQGGALILPYYGLLFAFPQETLSVFYGAGSPYLQLASVLRLLALSYAALYLVQVLGALLNGLELSRAVFWTQLANALVTLGVVLPLAAWGGIAAGLKGGILSALVQAIACASFLRRARTEPAL
jgi:O-antigen/teichoic acid export membrane protein